MRENGRTEKWEEGGIEEWKNWGNQRIWERAVEGRDKWEIWQMGHLRKEELGNKGDIGEWATL